MAESSNAPPSSPRVCTGQQMGKLTEFKLKEDVFNAWIEWFELYVSLNEINSYKKHLLFLTLLGNDGFCYWEIYVHLRNQVEKKWGT